MGERMTNHDNSWPSGQKSTDEIYTRYMQKRNHHMEQNDIYKQSMTSVITALGEVSLSWSQQLYLDMKGVTSPLHKQIQAIFESLKPDYSWIGAELAEYSRVALMSQTQGLADIFTSDAKWFAMSLSKQTQAIFDDINPNYSLIDAGLADFGRVSLLHVPQVLTDGIKQNGKKLAASLAKTSMSSIVDAIQFDSKSIASITVSSGMPWNITKSYTSFGQVPYRHYATASEAAIWSTAYDLETLCRRENVVAILKKSGIHYETPLFGAYDAYMRKHTDYKRHVFTSMRTVFDDLTYECVNGISTDQLCESLEKKGVTRRHYTKKDGNVIRSHAAILYLSIVRPIPKEKKQRLIQLSMTMNNLHKADIQYSDLEMSQLILEMEIFISEVFPDWLNPGSITPSC